MKVSVSIPEADLKFLDRYAEDAGLDSRSAVVQRAIRMLRTSELGEAYAAAWEEWAASEDAQLWETTVGDGLDQA
jgi:Arc/MetJ-type ribon-helix-helix transcriptional regulator